MTTNNEGVIREFLRDPLLTEKGYLKEGESETLNLGRISSIKMVELIQIVITNKSTDESENIITRKVNNLLNNTTNNKQ